MATLNYIDSAQDLVESFESFNWTPESYPDGTDPHIYQLGRLVNHVKDVASGTAFIFELISARSVEKDTSGTTYLNENQIGKLERLAMRALEDLDAVAEKIALDLNKFSGEKA